MAYEDTEKGFIDYRYYKPKYHYVKKIALKIDVNQDNNVITFSCAICSDEDNFCRKTAREITDKRMANGEIYTGRFDREQTLVENVMSITKMIAGRDESSKDPAIRLIRQLDEAFAEVEIAKMIEDSDLTAGIEF